MTEQYSTAEPHELIDTDKLAAEVKHILETSSPEAIILAAELTTQLPHMHAEGMELVLNHTVDERIALAVTRLQRD